MPVRGGHPAQAIGRYRTFPITGGTPKPNILEAEFIKRGAIADFERPLRWLAAAALDGPDR